MLFTSLEFLLLFLPGTLAVHFLLPRRARNLWLLLTSLLFYAWGEPRFVLVMAGLILADYLAALWIEKLPPGSGARRAVLVLTLIVNLGQLFVFKYCNFTVSVLRELIPAARAVPQTRIALPIGISFFTFQALSYVVDVYRGEPAQKKLTHLALYIAFFPQLIAGPIVRYTTIAGQLEKREITLSSFAEGVRRFLLGFAKKILLANILAEIADKAFAADELSVGLAWLGAVAYSLQIFFDFAGYSEMAIGLGRMFGFRFLENFNDPYISKTVTEFWRRWHISLGTWLRDYLYFPLGGSRVKSRLRLVFNLAVVWLATGVWHGANWTFLLWGLLHGAFVILEKLLRLPEKLERHPFPAALWRVLTLLIVVIGWVFFRAESVPAACGYLGTMFGLAGAELSDAAFRFQLREYAVILIAALLCATPLFARLKAAAAARGPRWGTAYDCAESVLLFILFAVSISCLVMNAHNPFIYFNF